MANKTKADPAGQRANRAKANKALIARLRRCVPRVLASFNQINRSIKTNAEEPFWIYAIRPEEMEQLAEDIGAILDEEMGTAPRRVAPDWFMLDKLELPYRQATQETVVQYNKMVRVAQRMKIKAPSGLAPQEVEAGRIVTSAPYKTELKGVYVRSYQTIKGFSNDTTLQLVRVIQDGVNAGDSPPKITTAIKERFNVAESRAARIANTEVQWAYNKARLDAVVLADLDTGMTSKVIHISALLQSTREAHAARHEKVYTPEAQRSWWLRDANMINCKCTVRPVLVDENGDVLEK